MATATKAKTDWKAQYQAIKANPKRWAKYKEYHSNYAKTHRKASKKTAKVA